MKKLIHDVAETSAKTALEVYKGKEMEIKQEAKESKKEIKQVGNGVTGTYE